MAMKAIRGQQPLIPSLWNLEQDRTETAAFQDPLLIHQQPVATDAQAQDRREPGPVEADGEPESLPSTEPVQQSTGRRLEITGFTATSAGVGVAESGSMEDPAPGREPSSLHPLEQRQSQADAGTGAAVQAAGQADTGGFSVRTPQTDNRQTTPDPGSTAPGSASGSNETQPNSSDQMPLAICEGLLKEEAASIDTSSSTWTSSPLLDLSQTFRLHSNPTAARIIYLDFDGHTTTGTVWNSGSMGASFYSPAYDLDGNPSSFSTTELTRIQQIWQRVTSDFAPFDVDVTTQAPPDDWLIRSDSADANYGIRVVTTNYGPSVSTAGGIAIVDSFTASTDTPAFVYNISVVGVSEAISHEVGHTLGLSHDGTATTAYYAGHGSGETAWGPIMGVPYNVSVATWDDGSYYGSNNATSTANYGKGADDIAIISTRNGFSANADSIGSSITSASPLTVLSGGAAQFGTIETRSDRDVYSFQLLDTGSLDLTFSPYCYRAYVDSDGVWGGASQSLIAPISDFYSYTNWPENSASLDLSVALFNSAGQMLASSNPEGLAASLSASNLTAGTYFLALDGVGYGDPTSSSPTGYTDYCSIGNYWISGSIVNAIDNSGPGSPGSGSTTVSKPVLTISDVSQREGTSTSATAFQVSVNLSVASTSDTTVNFSSADGTAISTGSSSDYTSVSGTLRIAAGLTSGTISLAVKADSSVEADEQLFINLSNAIGADITDNQAVVTILNDDNLTKKRGQAKALLDSPSLVDPYAVPPAVDLITGEPVDQQLDVGAIVVSPVALNEPADLFKIDSSGVLSVDGSALPGLAGSGCSGLDGVLSAGLPTPGSDVFYGCDSTFSSSQLVI